MITEVMIISLCMGGMFTVTYAAKSHASRPEEAVNLAGYRSENIRLIWRRWICRVSTAGLEAPLRDGIHTLEIRYDVLSYRKYYCH